MALTKITAKIQPGLWAAFSKQTDALFLKRAAFLNHMILIETPNLEDDLDGRVLSTRAKRHIAGELKRHGAKAVNIEVEQATANALNAVVERSNIVRDAFVNRLLVFLRASNDLLNNLEIPKMVDDRRLDSGLESMPTSPLKAMEAVRDDPLFYIRNFLNEHEKLGVYSVALPRKLDWLACYLDDKEVPGTKAYNEEQSNFEEMFSLLETDALKKPAAGKRGAKK